MLTLLVVTKNHEEELARCLTAAQIVVDEIVIVDEGSIDDTKQVAASFGAKVLDSKGDPYNEGLHAATEEWVLTLSPEEVIFKQDLLQLRKFLGNATAIAYLLPTKHYTNNRQLAGWIPAQTPGFNGYTTSSRIRLFKKDDVALDKGYAEASIRAKGGLVQHIDDVPIHDYGYETRIKEEIARAKTEDIAGRYAKAIGSMQVEDYAQAVNLLLSVAKEDPHYKHTQRNLGTLYLKAGRFRESLTYFQEAIRDDKKDVTSYNNLGVAYKQLKDYDKAAMCFSEAARLAPKDPRPLQALARIYKLQGEQEKARALVEKALKVFPQDEGLKSEL